jgi:hypothetical protein
VEVTRRDAGWRASRLPAWASAARILSLPGVLAGASACVVWADHFGRSEMARRTPGMIDSVVLAAMMGCVYAVFVAPFSSVASAFVAGIGSLWVRPRLEVLASVWIPVLLGVSGWFGAAYTIGRAWSG